MRKSKNKNPTAIGVQPQRTVSPSPQVFHLNPQNLKREISTPSQKNWLEGTILYGEDDALPLRIAQAVDESPAASSCLDTVAQFIKGAGFSDPDLMKMVIDKNGTKLWDLHCALADSLALFWGFSVNFKFDKNGKITNAFQVSFESCRFKQPEGNSDEIDTIVYNPYFGTTEIKKEYTKEYPVYDLKTVYEQMDNMKKGFPGQVYYFGKTSPLHRFYPVPKYWSAKEAIQADHKLQEFNNEELENGFFQSVLMKLIGDPNAWSKNPRLQEEYTDDAGVKKRRATKTVGEEFNEMMSGTFAGSKKAGTAMVLWALNKEQSIDISDFPTGINGDRLIATQDSITKTITIATRVPSILANISEGVSLGSNGGEMQKAVELMQSRTEADRQILMNFYNEILLPNLAKGGGKKVEIKNFNPITVPVEVEDKVWDFMNEAERVAFIKKNMPGIEIIRTATPVITPVTPTPDPNNPDAPVPPATEPAQVNDALKNINLQQLDRIQKIVARFSIGLVDPSNKKALTFEQAKSFLLSYGLTEADIPNWLVTPEEI